MVPYRDFFDHHGFLTHYLFAPFVGSYAFIFLRILFVGIEVGQSAIMFYLVKDRTKNVRGSFFLLFIYCLIRFTVIQNVLWFDMIISFFILLAWFFAERKKEIMSWVFLLCASFVKPVALLLSIPFLLRSKQKSRVIFTIVCSWFIVFLFFHFQTAGTDFIDQLFFFNSYYVQTTFQTFYIGVSRGYLIFFFLLSLALSFYYYRDRTADKTLLVLFLLSLSFYFQGLAKLNLAIATPFLVLILANIKPFRKMREIKTATFLVIITLFFARDAYKTVKEIKSRKNYISQQTIQESKRIQSVVQGKNFVVLGNRPELYFFLGTKPIVQYVLYYPWIGGYYKVLSNEFEHLLTACKPEIVVVPRTFGEYEEFYIKFLPTVRKNYKQVSLTKSYLIWRYNKE